MPDLKKCSRPGCDKTLRSNNTTGMCATGCRSDAAKTRATPRYDDVMVRFKKLARLLGQDPDAMLAEANRRVAQAWLDKLAAATK